MKKKIISIVIALTCMVAVFTGCTQSIETSNAETVFTDAIAQNIANEGFLVKERIRKDSNNAIEFILNFKKGTDEVGKGSTSANFVIRTTVGVDTKSDSMLFAPSLKDGLKAKNATDADYQYYCFKSFKDGKKELVPATPTSIFDDESIANYKPANILAPLDELTSADMDFTAKGGTAFKKGYVTYYRFKVVKEGHAYSSYALMEVQIFQGKVLRIASMDEVYRLDITGVGSKISAPSYDTYLTAK